MLLYRQDRLLWSRTTVCSSNALLERLEGTKNLGKKRTTTHPDQTLVVMPVRISVVFLCYANLNVLKSYTMFDQELLVRATSCWKQARIV